MFQLTLSAKAAATKRRKQAIVMASNEAQEEPQKRKARENRCTDNDGKAPRVEFETAKQQMLMLGQRMRHNQARA